MTGTLIEVAQRPAYDEALMVRSLEGLYVAAKQHKSTLLQEWKRNFRLTKNRAAAVLPAAAGIRANEIFPTIDSRIGWMTDQEVIATITPAVDPYSPYAPVLDMMGEQLECVINSVYYTDQWYAEIVKTLWDAAMYGAGFLKSVWDAGLCNGLGNVALKSVSPWCLYVDPFAMSLDDADYVIEVHTMSPGEIERRFPEVSRAAIADAVLTGDSDNDHVPPTQATGGGRSNKGNYLGLELIPVDAGQGATTWGPAGGARYHTDMPQRAVNVYECWLKENFVEEVEPADPTLPSPERVVVTQWRVIVYAGGRILLDELAENLFHTNRHPYTRYVDVESGEFWGDPLVRDLGPCQMALNRLLALAQNNTEFTGNPVWIGVKGSGTDRSTFTNTPGRIYDVNGGANASGQKPGWINPPPLPPQLMELAAFWLNEIERIAGLQGGQRGEIPSGRATEKQVSATQEAGFIRVRSSQRNLEMTLRKAFELIANLIVINYDVSRTVAIVGPEGEMTSIRLAAQHFYDPSSPRAAAPMRFSLTVNAGAAKPTSRAARIAEANALYDRHAVDDQFLLQAYRVSHWESVLARKRAQEQQEAVLAALQGGGKGQPRGPGTGHPH